MKKALILSLMSIVLTACSTSQEDLLPVGDQTMADIWQGGGSVSQPVRPETRLAIQSTRSIESDDYANHIGNPAYTRTAANEATNLFPRLPNPDLVMYVFPHLTDTTEPVPVPGYTTVFPFFGRVQYAQPGERTRNY